MTALISLLRKSIRNHDKHKHRSYHKERISGHEIPDLIHPHHDRCDKSEVKPYRTYQEVVQIFESLEKEIEAADEPSDHNKHIEEGIKHLDQQSRFTQFGATSVE